MPQLSDRVSRFTDSVIRRMTRISNKYGAVNLSQGFPDFDPPKEILDRLAQVTRVHRGLPTRACWGFPEVLTKRSKVLSFSQTSLLPAGGVR